MYRRVLLLLSIGAFSVSAAHVAWWTFFCPLPAESFGITRMQTLRAPHQHRRNLYVRHNLHLPERPRSGWIRIQGPDVVELYINGEIVAFREERGTDTTIAVDVTRLLRDGRNVLAGVCRQSTLHRIPELAIEAEYILSDGLHRIGVENEWRCWSYFERTNSYWFAMDFDDSHWPLCAVSESQFIVAGTPLDEALITPSASSWIAPDEISVRDVVLKGTFEVTTLVKSASLRLQSNASYRMAINGVIADRQEGRFATDLPVARGHERIYDVAPLIQVGKNEIRLRLNAPVAPPQAAVEINLDLRDGSSLQVVGNEQWLWRSAKDGPWLSGALANQKWQACQSVDVIDGRQPSDIIRTISRVDFPKAYVANVIAKRAMLVLLITVVTWVAIWVVDKFIRDRKDNAAIRLFPQLALALIPSTVWLLASVLVEYDPRVSAESMYQPRTLYVALGAVIVQWMVIAIHHKRTRLSPDVALSRREIATEGLHATRPRPRKLAWIIVILVFFFGTYMRMRDITARPLSPDEVTMYQATMNTWEYGFPVMVIHENMPPVPAATSELNYLGSVVTSLFFSNDRVVVRLAPVVFGSITILLIFWVGARMFHPWVGVAAAAMYAFSPTTIGMTNVGRYYAQLQFFTLLVVYLYWKTIEPRNALNIRALWGTVGSYLAMFLTWEGSALLAVPMMITAIVQRRNRVHTLLCNKHVWLGIFAVGSVIVLQSGHRTLMQTARPLIGSGASDVSITRMWEYPRFDPWRYVLPAAWSGDALLPAIGLTLALIVVAERTWRRQIRLLLIVFLLGGLMQSAFIPTTADRYCRHYIPLFILLAASATLLAMRKLVGRWMTASNWRSNYANEIACLVTLMLVALSNGLLFDLRELKSWRESGGDLDALNVPGQMNTAAYLQEHHRPSDAVIVDAPHVMAHYFEGPVDYWLESQLHLQAVFDDKRPIPLHRLKGAMMLRDIDHLRDVFARHDRVWLITEPAIYSRANTPDVSKFVRDNMDVVFEDYRSMVLLKDDAHRSAVRQQKTDKSLNRARVHVP